MEEKVCRICNQKKVITEFHFMSRIKNTHRNECKLCFCANRKQRYQNNIEREKTNSRNYHKRKPETRRKANKKYQQITHREKYLVYQSKKQHEIRCRTYGISSEEFDKLYQAQQGKCAICGLSEVDQGKQLSIDHCHETKQIRGLLCSNCNLALGLLKDDIELLQSAISYLTKITSKTSL